MRRSLLGAVLTMGLSGGADAQTPVVGAESVIDGDTIEIRGQRIRLFGVDAPKSQQICVDAAGAHILETLPIGLGANEVV